MMSKSAIASAVLPALAIMVLMSFSDLRLIAQTTPADQTPATQQPAGATQQPAGTTQPATAQTSAGQQQSSQEPSDEDLIPGRRRRPKDYKNWVFNVGAGANLDTGTTKDFVRGGGFVGTAGVARNASRYLGLRADFLYADLPLKDSALELAQATGASSYLYSLTVNPIINIPVTPDWGGYIIFGGGYYHRGGTLNDDTTVPGSFCSGFWRWWGNCNAASVPVSGDFTHASLNQFGYDFGAGITRKTPSGVEVYAEYRIMHGTSNSITTDFRPITIGVRW